MGDMYYHHPHRHQQLPSIASMSLPGMSTPYPIQYHDRYIDHPDRRLPPHPDPYYRSDHPRPPVDFSQLDPSLVIDSPSTSLPLPHSPSSSSRSNGTPDESAAPSRPKKPRREKPRIELAPDQPLTTQGKPRARVYVACLQCRTRKIRCDGAKPTCHNCTRRAKSNDQCVYDAAPKRRGPDKTPGARQRMAREARQESEADVVASRRRRRKKHDTTSPPPHADPSVQPTPLTLPPLKQPSLVLDPLLADMAPFHPTPVTTTPSLHQLSLAPTSGSVVSEQLPVLQDAPLYHVPNSQGLHNILSFASNLDVYPPVVNESLTRAFISPLEDQETETSEESPRIISEPSLEFTRQTWWDSLLTLYSSSIPSIPASSRRQQAVNQITNDLRFLFRTSNYWFSFINVPHFFSTYFNPERRERMQPSFLPAALAIATFFQSSEAGYGKEGRQKAMRLRDIAQGALEASFNARWIDEGLAQAAWLLALFEVCSHPNHTSDRCSSGLAIMDTIIRALSLTFVDVENPAATRFAPHAVPSIASSPHSWTANQTLNGAGTDSTHSAYHAHGCSCASRTLGQRWAGAHEYTPLWVSSPAWDSDWSEAEIRKETCRRLCWSALVLTAGHTSYITSAGRAPPQLFIIEPANFALLFPGEAMGSNDGHSGKDTVWSLNYRTMLLWHSCLRMQHDPNATQAELARFGLNAWMEADALEKALDSHACGLERTFLFQGREYLFNVRSIITHEFQRYAPFSTGNINELFHKKAKEWLTHQANVAQRVVQSMSAVTGQSSHTLVHRPFFAFWFMSQISRALFLWECDNSLTLALDVGIALFKPIDYLSALWPCDEQRRRAQRIREALSAACRKAGRTPPPPSPPEIAFSD